MQQNNKNILFATVLSMVILIAWTWLYEKPRAEKKLAMQEAEQALIAEQKFQEEKAGAASGKAGVVGAGSVSANSDSIIAIAPYLELNIGSITLPLAPS